MIRRSLPRGPQRRAIQRVRIVSAQVRKSHPAGPPPPPPLQAPVVTAHMIPNTWDFEVDYTDVSAPGLPDLTYRVRINGDDTLNFTPYIGTFDAGNTDSGPYSVNVPVSIVVEVTDGTNVVASDPIEFTPTYPPLPDLVVDSFIGDSDNLRVRFHCVQPGVNLIPSTVDIKLLQGGSVFFDPGAPVVPVQPVGGVNDFYIDITNSGLPPMLNCYVRLQNITDGVYPSGQPSESGAYIIHTPAHTEVTQGPEGMGFDLHVTLVDSDPILPVVNYEFTVNDNGLFDSGSGVPPTYQLANNDAGTYPVGETVNFKWKAQYNDGSERFIGNLDYNVSTVKLPNVPGIDSVMGDGSNLLINFSVPAIWADDNGSTTGRIDFQIFDPNGAPIGSGSTDIGNATSPTMNLGNIGGDGFTIHAINKAGTSPKFTDSDEVAFGGIHIDWPPSEG